MGIVGMRGEVWARRRGERVSAGVEGIEHPSRGVCGERGEAESELELDAEKSESHPLLLVLVEEIGLLTSTRSRSGLCERDTLVPWIWS